MGADRPLRTLFSKAVNRLIVGAFAGLGFGSLCAILGVRLSGVDVSDAATFGQMVRLVGSYALGGAVILACFADFTYLYVRFLKDQETRFAHRMLGRGQKLWDGEVDGLRPLLSSVEEDEGPDRTGTDDL